MSDDQQLHEPLPHCNLAPWGFKIEGDYGLKCYRLICSKCGMHCEAPSRNKAIEKWDSRVLRMEVSTNEKDSIRAH